MKSKNADICTPRESESPVLDRVQAIRLQGHLKDLAVVLNDLEQRLEVLETQIPAALDEGLVRSHTYDDGGLGDPPSQRNAAPGSCSTGPVIFRFAGACSDTRADQREHQTEPSDTK